MKVNLPSWKRQLEHPWNLPLLRSEPLLLLLLREEPEEEEEWPLLLLELLLRLRRFLRPRLLERLRPRPARLPLRAVPCLGLSWQLSVVQDDSEGVVMTSFNTLAFGPWTANSKKSGKVASHKVH